MAAGRTWSDPKDDGTQLKLPTLPSPEDWLAMLAVNYDCGAISKARKKDDPN